MEETTNKVFHSRGEQSREDNRHGVKYEIDYLSQIHSIRQNPYGSGSRPWCANPPLDMPSDEFLNDYIPRNLDTNVTWRNVLACGMIPEQRNNEHIREDIQYGNIQIQYPEAPSPAPESSLVVEAQGIDVISCTIENDSIEIIYLSLIHI